MDVDQKPDVIATIRNGNDPDQVVAIRYLREANAFVTDGIERIFGVKELLIPAHMVISNFELMGTIVSAVLEKLSQAKEREAVFKYPSVLEAMGETYALTEEGMYIKLAPFDLTS
jgi:hypothetical protein